MASPRPDLWRVVQESAPIPTQAGHVRFVLSGTTIIVGSATNAEHAHWFLCGWFARLSLRRCLPPPVKGKLAQQWRRGWQRANTYAAQFGLNDLSPHEVRYERSA